MNVKVKNSGPLIDGTADKAVHDFLYEARKELGQHAVNEIQTELGHVLKHPTGYYKGHIQTTNKSDTNLVNDGGVVYGPWLEGVGSRNSRSRFKGYSTFRRIGQKLQDEANAEAEKVLPKYLGKMQ